MQHKNTVMKKSKNKKLIFALTAIILLAITAFVVFKLVNKTSNPSKTADGQPVNLQPATATEKSETDARKEQLGNETSPTTPKNSASSKSSTLTITDANATSVRAYVTGVFEDNGTCTAVATSSGQNTVTKSSSGFQNVSYTQCAPINWDSPLPAGSWQISVTYKSPTTESTQTKTIEVK
jgi:Tfp pilus assembly protein PilX